MFYNNSEIKLLNCISVTVLFIINKTIFYTLTDEDDTIGPKLKESVTENKLTDSVEPELLVRDESIKQNALNKRDWDKGKSGRTFYNS